MVHSSCSLLSPPLLAKLADGQAPDKRIAFCQDAQQDGSAHRLQHRNEKLLATDSKPKKEPLGWLPRSMTQARPTQAVCQFFGRLMQCTNEFSKGEAMKAYVVESANGPFRAVEIPTPRPASDQVLVKIYASGVNPLDTKIRAGQGGHAKQPLPAVLGLDMAGVVVTPGAGITAFREGDEVFGMVGGVGGLQGTLAEFIVADAALLAHKPTALTMRQSAALPLVTITAWEGLVDRARVHSGQSVLIHAGAGGVGYAAVQIALAYGAKVFTTVSDDKRSIVEAVGAVAISRHAAVEDYVAEHTGGEGFDIVYDTLSGAIMDASFQAVKRYTGHVVSCLGWGLHSLAPLSFRAATYSGVFTLLPLLTGVGRANHGHILREAAALADRHELKPLLAEHQFGPDDIAAAYDLVAKGSGGKVVLEL
jgi:NADPH:quinone reductase-like Zn-dependent oxidoreductase